MIAALVAVAIAPIRIVEVFDPAADRVTVQALVRLPALDSLGIAAAQVLAKTVLGDNDSFSRREMRALSAPGFEPQAYAMPDHIAIRFSVYPTDASTGVRIMAAIVTTTRLADEDIAAAIKKQSTANRSAWERALNPEPRQWDWLKHADVADLYRLTFRPENVTLAVGGPIPPGEAKTAWDEATADWQLARRPRRLPPGGQGSPAQHWDGPRIVELRGQPWSLAQDGAEANLLALIALGGGKGSSLFRNLRLEQGMSYRQEAALWPTRAGVKSRILVATDAEAGAVVSALKDAVSKWDESTLSRALGYAGGLFEWGGDLSPLYLRPSSPLGGSLEDRTLWAAYWEFKTETPWQAETWLEAAKTVTLDSLRAAAMQFLEEAEPIVHGSHP